MWERGEERLQRSVSLGKYFRNSPLLADRAAVRRLDPHFSDWIFMAGFDLKVARLRATAGLHVACTNCKSYGYAAALNQTN
jgi:hypothetical protein